MLAVIVTFLPNILMLRVNRSILNLKVCNERTTYSSYRLKYTKLLRKKYSVCINNNFPSSVLGVCFFPRLLLSIIAQLRIWMVVVFSSMETLNVCLERRWNFETIYEQPPFKQLVVLKSWHTQTSCNVSFLIILFLALTWWLSVTICLVRNPLIHWPWDVFFFLLSRIKKPIGAVSRSCSI